MTSNDDASGAPPESGGRSVAEQMFPWLLRRKITVPDRVPGYVHRAELLGRALPTQRRLTVLNASGGFGKTTLLAECCRMLRQDGVATAWVSLDEQDEPAVLDTYIAFACRDAGVNLLDGRAEVVATNELRFSKPEVARFFDLSLSRELHAVAAERRLRRTQMRASALSMMLEQRSGDPESAVGHFQEFLGLFAESPYAWPLVRERATCTAGAITCASSSPSWVWPGAPKPYVEPGN